MESGHVSRTDPAPHSFTSSGEVVVTKPRRSTEGTATPVSPTAAKEQQHDGSSPSPTSGRIPSHVFARTSTTTPNEWSEASNESLFSINAGNTSFSKEQLSLIRRSGELPCYNCDSINISSPLLELPRTRQFTDFATKSGNLDEGVGEFGVTESAAPEAMREVFMEQECQQKDDSPVEFSPHSRSISTHSDASVKSFAFPVLTGEGDKCGPSKNGTKNKKEQSQPSISLEENPDISQENPKPEDSQETLKTQTQKSTKNAGSKKWFSCFSCCSSCS